MMRKKFTIVFIALFILSVMSAVINKQQTMSTYTQLNNTPAIILDPGHGGFDGGAIGYDGTIEKDLNLEIALKINDILKINGFKVIMTRTEDVSTCDDNLNSIREKKKSDIHNRMDLIKEHPSAIFVSIHQNKFEESRYNGAQIFYSTNNPESEELAQIIQQTIVSNLQPNNKREIKPSDESIYLLYYSENPAVLVECGFISNPEECIMLQDDDYQNKLAFSISIAIMDYINKF